MLPTSRRRAVAIVPVIATLALVLAACNGGGATPTAVPASTPTPAPTAVPTPTSAPVPTPTPAPRETAEIVDQLRPSVVHIQTEAVRLDQFNRPVPTDGVGTGEIIDAEGLILTNNHVIADARRILVTLSDGRFKRWNGLLDRRTLGDLTQQLVEASAP